MYYDSMIAKLITHGGTRAEAHRPDARRAQRLRHPRHLVEHRVPGGAGPAPAVRRRRLQHRLHRRGVPQGLPPPGLSHQEPLLLAAVAAYARRRYIDRAVRITGQLKGHERRVGTDWVVLMQGQRFPLEPDARRRRLRRHLRGRDPRPAHRLEARRHPPAGHLERRADLPPGRADGPEVPRLPLGHPGRRHRHDRPRRRAAGADARQAAAGPVQVPALPHARAC